MTGKTEGVPALCQVCSTLREATPQRLELVTVGDPTDPTRRGTKTTATFSNNRKKSPTERLAQAAPPAPISKTSKNKHTKDHIKSGTCQAFAGTLTHSIAGVPGSHNPRCMKKSTHNITLYTVNFSRRLCMVYYATPGARANWGKTSAKKVPVIGQTRHRKGLHIGKASTCKLHCVGVNMVKALTPSLLAWPCHGHGSVACKPTPAGRRFVQPRCRQSCWSPHSRTRMGL